jgi:hypothetical protein
VDANRPYRFLTEVRWINTWCTPVGYVRQSPSSNLLDEQRIR